MALGAPVAGDVRRRRRTTRLLDLTTQPQRAQPRTRSGRPGQTGTLPTPKSETTRLRPDQSSPKADRWIEADTGQVRPTTHSPDLQVVGRRSAQLAPQLLEHLRAW